MKKIILLFCLFSLNILTLSAQSGKLPWVEGVLPPKSNSFDYMVSRGEGNSLKSARTDAFNSFLIDLGNNAGVTVTSRTLSEIKRSMNYSGGETDYDEGETSITTYRIDREGFNASFIKVSEWYEYVNGTYHVWELYEVSSRRSFRPCIPEYSGKYGAEGVWRSMLLPGWGQLYKGSKSKGLFIIGGEVALIGGLVACENLRASYMQKIGQTHAADHIRTYAQKADDFKNIRNLCITGAAAMYLYNLIDAIAAQGKPHLVKANRRYAFYPVADSEQYAGIGFTLNF